MSRLIRMTLSVMLLASIAVAPANARSRREKPEHSWDNLKKLRVGEEIQVVYGREQYLNGRFLGFTSEGISVQWGVVNRHDETIPREDVIRVIASRPNQRVKNGLIGVAAGAAAGGLPKEFWRNRYYSGPIDLDEIGAAIGAVFGGVIGALSSPDATIYEARLQDVQAEPRLKQDDSPAREDAATNYDTQTSPQPDNGETPKSFCCSIPLIPGQRSPHDGPLVR